MLVTSQYQPRLSSITIFFSWQISQSDCSIHIEFNYFTLTGFHVQAFADIVFLYDDSGSVGSNPKNFLLMKTFMKNIVGGFSFCGIGGTQFGAACFAQSVKNHFHLKTHSTSTAVQDAIMKFPTRNGHATAIGTALAVGVLWYLGWEQFEVSEWLLFNANSANFQLYHGENKLLFNEMRIRPTLC